MLTLKSKHLSRDQNALIEEEAYSTEMQNGHARLNANWFNDALQSFQTATDLAIKLNDKQKLADAYFFVGDCHIKLHQFDQALKAIQNARFIFQRLKLYFKVVSCLRAESFVYRVTANSHKSLKFSQKALTICESNGYGKQVALVLWGISSVYIESQKHHKALKTMQLALDKMVAEGEAESADNIRIDLAQIYYGLGEVHLALQILDAVINRAKSNNNEFQLAFAYADRGLIYARSTQYDEAIQDYQEALKLFRKRGVKRFINTTLSNYASILYLRGDFETALDLLNEASQLAIEAKLPFHEMNTLRSQAAVEFSLGKMTEAFTHIDRVINYFFQLNNKLEEFYSISLRGEFHAENGDFISAKRDLDEVVFYAKKFPNNPLCAIMLYQCAYWYSFWGENEQATQLFNLANRQKHILKIKYVYLISLIPKCMLRINQDKQVILKHTGKLDNRKLTHIRMTISLFKRFCDELDKLKIAPTNNIGFFRSRIEEQLLSITTNIPSLQ